jgi:hypothetical protein
VQCLKMCFLDICNILKVYIRFQRLETYLLIFLNNWHWCKKLGSSLAVCINFQNIGNHRILFWLLVIEKNIIMYTHYEDCLQIFSIIMPRTSSAMTLHYLSPGCIRFVIFVSSMLFPILPSVFSITERELQETGKEESY